MQKRVISFIRQHQMVQQKDRIVAGVSGGADSVFLFYLLLELKTSMGISFGVVHVNHGLRGKESDEDEQFVNDLCGQYGIPCKVCRISVDAIAKKERISLEEAGRSARYQAFAEAAKMWGANKIALAHHRNDCAETMLYHLARGTGIAGLCSLRPVRNSVIRPLLCMNREEIEQDLKRKQISWRTDSTNDCLEYTRNKIRHRILPVLTRDINERTVEHMAAASQDLEEVWDYLQEKTARLVKEWVCWEEDGCLVAKELAGEAAVFRKQVFLECLARMAKTRKNITRIHLEDLDALLSKSVGKQLDLPYSLKAVSGYQGVQIRKNEAENEGVEAVLAPLPIGGGCQVWEYRFDSAVEENRGQRIPEKTYTKWLDYDKIKGTIMIRTRLPKDYLVVNAAGGRKKLKDYLIDQKVPRQKRDQILVAAVGSEVLWVVGYRIGQNYMVNEGTKQILRIEIKGGALHE